MNDGSSFARGPDEKIPLVFRRLRHITSIQVRNLTPFPVQDSFASALTRPAEQSQFTSHGHLSDDLDVVIHRNRHRRTSTTSSTIREAHSEDGIREEGTIVERVRKTSQFGGFPPEESDELQQLSPGSTPSIRPRRVRTSSMASSIGSRISASHPTTSLFGTSAPTVSNVFDSSQEELEKVISSRLVDSFITILVPPPTLEEHTPDPAQKNSPSNSSILRTKSLKAVDSSSDSKFIKPSPMSTSDRFKTQARPDLVMINGVKRCQTSHVKAISTSGLKEIGGNKRARSFISSQKNSINNGTPIPDYFSFVHPPSTHPIFSIDPPSEYFPDSTDLSGHHLKIEVWGKVGVGAGRRVSIKGKEKAIETDGSGEWKMLEERNINLMDLVPLSAASLVNTAELPHNSVFITLSPPGEIFYLPTPSSFTGQHPIPHSEGYASDPESDTNRFRRADFPNPTAAAADANTDVLALSRRRLRGGGATPFSQELSTTASWQDLLKLVTLQSCILDDQTALSEVTRDLDELVKSDVSIVKYREVMEREARLQELASNHKQVKQEIKLIRQELNARLEALQQRKRTLHLAKEQFRQDLDSDSEVETNIVQDRARLFTLNGQFGPTRTTLLSILSSIYPIELLSPPDLLYTILDVPLPIPLAATDPAPSLSLPSHKDVTEEAVATSLGYAAQVLQLLAAYLGKALVYPVTCIGSRSLIRDNISTMVGPRTFPLYSKGVDTYRFEYGVFLLNKDIEMLMGDRDLRAMDMRHTLPNLKNLLLTLTDGEGVLLPQRKSVDSPTSLVSAIEPPSRSESPVDTASTTPKASDGGAADENTPPASGSTTPTAGATDSLKRPRPFLTFSPLTDFLRGRYPSSSRISNSDVDEGAESRQGPSADLSGSSDTDEDHNVSDDMQDANAEVSYSQISNGGGEKLDGNYPRLTNSSPLPLAPVG